MPWTYGGQTISQPGTIVVADNSGISAPPNTNIRELVLIGSSGGGKPKTVLTITDPTQAQQLLVSGQGLTAVLRALRPSTDDNRTPGVVKFVRVDPALQSTYNLVNGATTVVTLTSVDYGDYTKQISTQVQAGSIQGLKATITPAGGVPITQDNIYQSLISVQYTGAAASGLLTVSNASNQMQGLSGASGSETVQWTASFATYTTVQQLINYINSQPGWTASLLTANPNSATANGMDDATAVPCKASAATITGTLQSLVNWYNSTGIVTATRTANTGLLPSTMSAPAYFTGGSNGTITNTDWSDAYKALQNESAARIITPISGDSSIHAMGDAHCALMSDPKTRKNRVQIVGGVKGETVSQVLARAQLLNSRRTTLVWPGIQDIDPFTLTLTTYDPYIAAAQAAGILSSMKITNALTRQVIACKGLEGTLQQTLLDSDYDNLTDNGVMAIKFFSNTQGNAFRFVRSVTTWLQDKKLVNVEISCVCTEDYVNIRVGDAVDALIGQDGAPVTVGMVSSAIDSQCRQLFEEQVLVGDTLAESYGNIQVNLSQGAVTSSFNATIPAPLNFAGITTKFGLYSSNAA
ncbi:hypothetical protein SD70_02525 [Gordoniibacillus kamchatkensis]|uniref:Tail sheath protein subtilisin-like domain-containing protein n=1 Tax=Gordoniibacillus kamchatkensis TaxID=1590651 RepID=A0ABR5AMM3_9BACL|nr:hypothetical protein [Paenibacillus sp. VKM B-2647]KIL42078.1 hypothetical protein SD70_02525 [Paenibacillus sp. VKM B-2647]